MSWRSFVCFLSCLFADAAESAGRDSCACWAAFAPTYDLQDPSDQAMVGVLALVRDRYGISLKARIMEAPIPLSRKCHPDFVRLSNCIAAVVNSTSLRDQISSVANPVQAALCACLRAADQNLANFVLAQTGLLIPPQLSKDAGITQVAACPGKPSLSDGVAVSPRFLLARVAAIVSVAALSVNRLLP
jgi:hypothetical protein